MTPFRDRTASVHPGVVQPYWLCATAGLALFWVVFLWNFWERGPFALGINAAVFLLLALLLLVQPLLALRSLAARDFAWIIPFVLMSASFAIYDNPFWKMTSILIMPVAFAVFYLQAFTAATARWTPAFFGRIALRCLSIIQCIGTVGEGYTALLAPQDALRRRVIVRIIAGLVILTIVAVVIVIPLLASADTAFKTAVDAVYGWLGTFISLTVWYRAFVFLILSFLFAAVLVAWGRPFTTAEETGSAKDIDPIVAGIVLGGLLVLYLLFLGIQLSRLWVGELPFDFQETESLVKSGFWQLLFLSILNILVYFFVYRKTVSVVQYLLVAFTGASLLLLASAGYRMGLYVTYYGFSYEKFFASYAVLYCAILFGWLIAKLFARTPADIVKFVALLFIWMYALVAVFPVEQFIVRTNVALAQREDSRIRLFEMTMLSPDVLGIVKQYNQAGRLQENGAEKPSDWQPWIREQEERIADKAWYEYTLGNLVQ